MSLIYSEEISGPLTPDKYDEMGLFEYDPSKSICYTRSIFKTMCLFYDQVYVDWLDFTHLLSIGETPPKDAIFLSKEITGRMSNYLVPNDPPRSTSNRMTNESERVAFTEGVMRSANEIGVSITPIYGTIFDHKEDKGKGENVETIQMAIDIFPGIKESDLEWEQVDEVRSDIDSIGGFRRVRNLISAIGSCDSKIEAEDLIAKRIEDYKNACKKHGIKTTKNLLGQVCNKETFISAVGSFLATGSLEAGAAIGGIKLFGDIGVTAYESIVDRNRLNNQHPVGATAVIYEENFGD